MKASQKLESTVNYTNGSPAIYTGLVKEVFTNGNMVVIDPTNEAEIALYEAGFAVGSYITPNQIIK